MGPKNGTVTRLYDNGLLASTKGAIPKTISVSDAARHDGGTFLPIGTVLCLVTDNTEDDFGFYREFDSTATGKGNDDPSTAVILAHDVDVADALDGKIKASAYIAGTFKRDKVKFNDDTGFDWGEVQRLILWPAE